MPLGGGEAGSLARECLLPPHPLTPPPPPTPPLRTRPSTDIYGVVEEARASPLTAQRIAAAGQAFAWRHLNEEALWGYWEEAVRRYNALMRPAPA